MEDCDNNDDLRAVCLVRAIIDDLYGFLDELWICI